MKFLICGIFVILKDVEIVEEGPVGLYRKATFRKFLESLIKIGHSYCRNLGSFL